MKGIVVNFIGCDRQDTRLKRETALIVYSPGVATGPSGLAYGGPPIPFFPY